MLGGYGPHAQTVSIDLLRSLPFCLVPPFLSVRRLNRVACEESLRSPPSYGNNRCIWEIIQRLCCILPVSCTMATVLCPTTSGPKLSAANAGMIPSGRARLSRSVAVASEVWISTVRESRVASARIEGVEDWTGAGEWVSTVAVMRLVLG